MRPSFHGVMIHCFFPLEIAHLFFWKFESYYKPCAIISFHRATCDCHLFPSIAVEFVWYIRHAISLPFVVFFPRLDLFLTCATLRACMRTRTCVRACVREHACVHAYAYMRADMLTRHLFSFLRKLLFIEWISFDSPSFVFVCTYIYLYYCIQANLYFSLLVIWFFFSFSRNDDKIESRIRTEKSVPIQRDDDKKELMSGN